MIAKPRGSGAASCCRSHSRRGVELVPLWLPVILYTGFIFWVSSAPRALPGAHLFPRIDKLYHVMEYAPLGALLARAFRRSPRRRWRWGLLYAAATIAAAAIGLLDEWYQRFTPLRVSSGWDAACDIIGAGLGQVAYRARSQ